MTAAASLRAVFLWALLLLMGWQGTCLAAAAPSADADQVQAVFAIKGACYPVSDKDLTQVITNVINPLTGSPWGNPIQSGSYTGLCAKLPNGCPGTASSTPAATTKSATSSDSSTDSSSKTPAPSPSPSPAAAASSPKPPNVATNPLSGGGVIRSPSPSRRLLQGSCSGSSLYLYLDMTNPGDSEALVATVTELVKSGEFLKKLTSSTSLEATEVYLQDIGAVQVALPPSPSPATKGGTAAALGSSPAQTLTLPDDLTTGILVSDPSVDSSSGSSPPSGNTITSFGTPSTSANPTPAPTASTQPVLAPKTTTTTATPTAAESDSSDSGTSNTTKIIIISATVGGVVLLAVFLGTAMVCLSNNNRQARAKVQADLIAHRRERMREKSKRPSFSSNTTLDRLATLRQAQAVREAQAAREAQNSKRTTPGSGRWAETSGGPAPLAHSVVVTPLQEPAVNSESSRVLNEGYERSSQPEVAPQANKTGRFFGWFGSKG